MLLISFPYSSTTLTNVVEFEVLLFPNCPCEFNPLVNTLLSFVKITIWESPVAICLTLELNSICFGSFLFSVSPNANWPQLFAPQLQILPSDFNAILKSLSDFTSITESEFLSNTST